MKETNMRSKVMSHLLIRIGLVILAVGIINIFFSTFFLTKDINQHHDEDMHVVTRLVEDAMTTAHRSQLAMEHLVDLNLLTVAKVIADELRGTPLRSITQEQLQALSQRFQLAGISLFVRTAEDIVVAKSSEERELGLGSKQWGYWHDAFQQLMDRKIVDVGKGFSQPHFWAGPISKSEIEDVFYKYAYYYDGTTEYMINPFIQDTDIHRSTIAEGPAQLIERIVAESPLIEGIAVINIPAILKEEGHIIIEPDRDTPVLYGEDKFPLPQDRQYLEEILAGKVESSRVSFTINGEEWQKIYIPLASQRVLLITSNLDQQHQMKRQLVLLSAGSLLIALLSLFVIIRMVARRQLRPLQEIIAHIELVSKGNLTKSLNIREHNEWDYLASRINLMTDKMKQLILQIKGGVDSLQILSNLLSRRVYHSMDSVNTLSLSMTDQSRVQLSDLDMCSERLSGIAAAIADMDESPLSPEVRTALRELRDHLDSLTQLERSLQDLSRTQANSLTRISITFQDGLRELSEIIGKVDITSEELKQRIEKFSVNESTEGGSHDGADPSLQTGGEASDCR